MLFTFWLQLCKTTMPYGQKLEVNKGIWKQSNGLLGWWSYGLGVFLFSFCCHNAVCSTSTVHLFFITKLGTLLNSPKKELTICSVYVEWTCFSHISRVSWDRVKWGPGGCMRFWALINMISWLCTRSGTKIPGIWWFSIGHSRVWLAIKKGNTCCLAKNDTNNQYISHDVSITTT